MRYFEKKLATEQLPIFFQWHNENKEAIHTWINNAEKTGDNLWEQLGKTFGIVKTTEIDPKMLRNELETALFNKQNGLCCYCGNAIERTKNQEQVIWVYVHRAIEHFYEKNRTEFKKMTFDIANLMLCCKESQRLTSFEFGKIYENKVIQNFRDVAILVNLPESVLKSYDKNEAISKRLLKKGDSIYVPNPTHCDDEKSKFDSKKEHFIIINPSVDNDLIKKLIFQENGKIGYAGREVSKNEIIENTFKVLALNCSTLVEKRQEKWTDSYVNYTEKVLPILTNESIEIGLSSDEDIENFISANVSKLIEGKGNPNDEGLLESFYFVEIAFLKSLFNGKL